MTARAVLVAVVGLVAAACSHGSPGADARGTTGGAVDGAEPTCRLEQAELDRRDEAGTIDWDAMEGSEEEPTEQELASVVVDREPSSGEVATVGERPTFPDFPARLDVTTLSDRELVEAVDICYEIGVLAEEADEVG